MSKFLDVINWGRVAATLLAAGDRSHAPPPDLCPFCAVLVDAARALDAQPHVTV